MTLRSTQVRYASEPITPPKITMILIMRMRKSELVRYSIMFFVRYSPPLRGGECPLPSLSQFIQDLFGPPDVQTFVKLAVDLDHRRCRTGSQAFKFDRREKTVACDLAEIHTQLSLHAGFDFIRAAQQTRQVRAHHNVIL